MNLSKTKVEVPTLFQNRLDFIEALRGWAALYVIVFHLARVPVPAPALPLWASKVILMGSSGVTLFFVVSAFTLAYSMRMHEQQPHSLQRFYVRRIFRIVPLFYVWIVLSWLRDQFFYEKPTSVLMILLSTTLTFNLVVSYQQGMVWSSWTIGVEMLFYLIFPLIYRHINNLPKALGFLLVALAISSVYEYLLLHYSNIKPAENLPVVLKMSFLHQLPVFAVGMVAFFVFEKFIQHTSISSRWGFLLLGASAVGFSAFLDGQLKFLLNGEYWTAILYSLLVLGLAISPIPVFVNRFSMFAGKLSYSIYLNHYAFVVVLTPIYATIYAWPVPVEIQFGACYLLILALLLPVSLVTYYLIEKPGMQLGTYLIKRLSSRPVESVIVVSEPVKQE